LDCQETSTNDMVTVDCNLKLPVGVVHNPGIIDDNVNAV
jgi:hypothetical protein